MCVYVQWQLISLSGNCEVSCLLCRSIQMNQSDASKGTQTCRWVITEHVFTVSWENTPRWVSIPTKTINHHPSVSLLSPSQSFSPCTPTHILSTLSFCSLFLIFVSPTLSSHALFFIFKESGLSTSFCFSSIYRL